LTLSPQRLKGDNYKWAWGHNLIVRSIRALQTFVFFAFYLLYASQAFAGAWNLEPGDGQIISTYNYSKASKAFTDIGDPVVEFEKNEGRIF